MYRKNKHLIQKHCWLKKLELSIIVMSIPLPTLVKANLDNNSVTLWTSLRKCMPFTSTCHWDFIFLFLFFLAFDFLSVLRGHSFFSSPPQRPMTSHFEGFSIPDFIHYIYFPILILEKEPVFSLLNVQC